MTQCGLLMRKDRNPFFRISRDFFISSCGFIGKCLSCRSRRGLARREMLVLEKYSASDLKMHIGEGNSIWENSFTSERVSRGEDWRPEAIKVVVNGKYFRIYLSMMRKTMWRG